MKIIIDGTGDEVRALLCSGGGGSTGSTGSRGSYGTDDSFALASPTQRSELDQGQVGEEVRAAYRSFQGAREQATREARGAGTRAAAGGGGGVRAETRDLLEASVAEGYTLVDPAGNFLERSEMLEDITTGATDFDVERSEEVMKTFGNHTAVWISVITMRGQVNGQDFTGRYRDVETFVRAQGGWQLVHSNLTPITGTASTTRR